MGVGISGPNFTLEKSPWPDDADSLYFGTKEPSAINEQKPDRDNGSNNWAVSGKKTKSGVPILCNDPHLSLNLPSLWFEMQLLTPGFNAYGVSFPGAPGIIIGFNDSCAFGCCGLHALPRHGHGKRDRYTEGDN